MEKSLPLDTCRNVFKSGEPSRDAYTSAWIKLINNHVHLDDNLTKSTQIDDITGNEIACPTEGEWDNE